jgi:hypothetical protein
MCLKLNNLSECCLLYHRHHHCHHHHPAPQRRISQAVKEKEGVKAVA